MSLRTSIGRGILVASVLLIPAFAHAMEETTWDFTNGTQNAGEWQVQGLSMQQGPDGLHIKGEGVIIHKVSTTHATDVVSLIFARTTNVPLIFAWHKSNGSPSDFVQMGIQLTGASPDTQDLYMHSISVWDPWTDAIAIQVKTDQDIVLSGIRFRGYSVWEKFGAAWTSFWMVDQTLSYTINFQWGPLLVFTPVEFSQMFTTQPPIGWSIHRFSYAVLALALIALAAYAIFRKFRGPPLSFRHMALLFFIIFGTMWAIHDIRMGYEFLFNNVTDLRTYTFAEPGKKSFRNLVTFHDALYRNLPLLEAQKTYAVLGPKGGPLQKMAGYATYPVSRPIFSDEPIDSVPVVFVFRRADVSVNANNELTIGGVVSTKPGHIVERFDADSFLFQIP